MIPKDTPIGIVGLGVLGGSYCQALSEAGYTNLIGIDIDETSIRIAEENGWIRYGSSDASALQDCYVVICCLYPGVFVQWVKDHQNVLKHGCLLSDVTGVKRMVIREIRGFLRDDVEFIACHPMAGREFRGIRYADAGRFKAANFIIVTDGNNSDEAISAMRQLASDMRFKTITILTSEKHDRMISYLSQLTHVIAVSLMNANEDDTLAFYTGDSFRDLTRIARINEEMWPELFVLNKDYLTEDIDRFIAELQEFRELICTENEAEMKKKMIQSTARRALFDKEGSER
ncbi:MAG: prephenate dehydrogenase [Solobacterium sp.]|nr:prephenate dehydrogenase [Solobacterium sp.]